MILFEKKKQATHKNVEWFTTKVYDETPQKFMIKHHKSWWWNATKIYDKTAKFIVLGIKKNISLFLQI